MAPPVPEQLYQLQEFGKKISKFVKILYKIEAEFKIKCNFELPSYLGKKLKKKKLYENIIAQQNKSRKIHAFMDSFSKFSFEKGKIKNRLNYASLLGYFIYALVKNCNCLVNFV